MTKFNHTCEVCGKQEMLTSQESYEQGWDYPPNMGAWTIISPRTCGECSINETVWWALTVDRTPYDKLTPEQQETVQHILAEVPVD